MCAYADAVENYGDSIEESLGGYPLPFVLMLASFLMVTGYERHLVSLVQSAKAADSCGSKVRGSNGDSQSILR